jgi:hypothetical protein
MDACKKIWFESRQQTAGYIVGIFTMAVALLAMIVIC